MGVAPKAATRHRTPTKRQAAYIDARLQGADHRRATKMAGYAGVGIPEHLIVTPTVARALQAAGLTVNYTVNKLKRALESVPPKHGNAPRYMDMALKVQGAYAPVQVQQTVDHGGSVELQIADRLNKALYGGIYEVKPIPPVDSSGLYPVREDAPLSTSPEPQEKE
jgi:hypothetical protein